MKKLLLILAINFSFVVGGIAQCATTSAPTNNCTFTDLISAFSLNGIPSVGNAGCSTNGYSLFPTPVRTLMLGNTYTWSATLGGTYSDGLAIWIDLNNDGQYSASEQVASNAPALTQNGSFTIPFSATPANNVAMRVRTAWAATIANTAACTNGIGGGYGETEDYLVNIVTPPACNGAPPTSTALSTIPATICPGTNINLYSSANYTLWGYSFQWQSATQTQLGPYTAVPGGTNTTLTATNLTTSTWFQEVIACGSLTTFATPIQIMVQGTTTNSVPYAEGFEGLISNNTLPNCSWASTNMPLITQTYIQPSSYNRIPHTGSKFASFRYGGNTAGEYYYSNGIQLNSGITYSAGAWYIVDGLQGWSEFSVLYGTAQSTTGLVPIASSTGTLATPFYQPVSNTFTVANSGIYYLAVKAVGNSSPWYLTFDDLFVSIPCTAASANSPTVALSVSAATVCQGGQVSLTASGANTYTWSTGANTASILVSPSTSTSYAVNGTNTLTSCGNTKNQVVTVFGLPGVSIYVGTPTVCSGDALTLLALGANSYTWSTSNTGQAITVNPLSNAVYSVSGASAFGCVAASTASIVVNPLPTIGITSSKTLACVGDQVTLNATGGVTYQWISNTSPFVFQGTAIPVSPTSITIYTVTGTDVNGCVNKATITQDVTDCTGINSLTKGSANIKVYPNPSHGEFTVEVGDNTMKLIELMDLSGRKILSVESSDQKIGMNVAELANGFYYIKIKSAVSTEVIKIVKQ